MRFPLGAMTVGDILDRGLKLLFARLPTFYLINLLVLSPVFIVLIAVPFIFSGGANSATIDPVELITIGLLIVVAGLVALILQPLSTAAILYIVMQEYTGKKASLVEAISFALSRFFSLLFASILVGLIVIVGTLCCCVPGIYFRISPCTFVGQVIVLEKLGIGESLQRSYNLIGGYRWRVFGILFLIGLAGWIVQQALQFGLGQALPASEPIPAAGGAKLNWNVVNFVITICIVQLVEIVFQTYIAVCTTLLYLDLRIRKEGFDLELAAQLDVEPSDPPRGREDDDEDWEDERERGDRGWDDRDDDDRDDDRRRRLR